MLAWHYIFFGAIRNILEKFSIKYNKKMALFGILFAVGALIFWGFGDFFIQRATREIGIWKSLFFISLTAVVILLPFIQGEIGEVLNNPKGLSFLLMAGVAIFAAALLIFESMKVGKLAIIEPILSLELPVAVTLGVFLAHENLNLVQLILIGVVFIGVVLAMTKHHTHLHYHKRIFERGVLYAFFGAMIMGATNFLIGISSQETSALLTIWFTSLMIAVFCFIYFVIKGRVKSLAGDLKKHIKAITSSSVLDNAAWISYAFATTYIPISIATTISESYIALAVGLGILVNKEKVNWHQIVGIVLAVSFLVSLPLGIATTLAVLVHEIPQEMADFAVLIRGGFSIRRALWLNFLVSLTTLAGAAIGYVFGSRAEQWLPYVLGVIAGNFLYIALSDLIPETHEESGLGHLATQLALMLIGISLMYAMS